MTGNDAKKPDALEMLRNYALIKGEAYALDPIADALESERRERAARDEAMRRILFDEILPILVMQNKVDLRHCVSRALALLDGGRGE